MVKILLLLFIMLPMNVWGSAYYTDYSFKERSDKYYEESDELRREEVKLYNNIKKSYSYEYVEKEYCDGVITDEFSVERFYSDTYNDGYISVVNLKQSDYKKVRYIFIYDYDMIEGIKEVLVYSNEKEIKTTIIDDFYDIYSGTKPYLIIDLNGIYDFSSISLDVVFDNVISDEFANYTMYFSYTGYSIPFTDVYINNFYVSKGVSNQTIKVISDDVYNGIVSKLNFSVPNKSAISYLYKDVYYYKCEYEDVFKSDEYTIEPLDGYVLDLDNYIIVYDYYERKKYEVLDVIRNKEEIFNLVKGDVSVEHSNIDINKNGVYEFYVGDNKHSVLVDIDENNKPSVATSWIKNDVFKEKIIYKTVNLSNLKKDNDGYKETTKVIDNDCVCNCSKGKENHRWCVIVIVMLLLSNMFFIGKYKYILTKGYKL